jgi:uncharacterized peroxidase-related enzyme
MFLLDPPMTDDLRADFDRARADDGYVANYVRLWGWRTDLASAFADLRNALMDSTSLSDRERALIVSTAVSTLGDSYCSLAWGSRLALLIGADEAALVVRHRESAALTARERALAHWVRKVVRDPNGTAPADVDALRSAGLGDREIFEATVLAAFRLAFSTVSDALGAVPDAEVYDAAPAPVRDAVTFGRAPH